MSNPHSGGRRRLPVNPNLENLKKQAKRLAKARPELSLQQAQHQLATEYGCRNWAELSHVVETMSRGATQTTNVQAEREPLPAAANRNDLEAVRRILHDGPFTQHDLDLALARAVLRFGERRAIAELLIEHGADPDGQYGSNYGPIIFVTGECLDPEGMQFLIDHGADVTFQPVMTKYGGATPLSHTLGTYDRGQNERKHRCIEILLRHGAIVPAEAKPAMLAIHRGDTGELSGLIDGDRSLVARRFTDMPYGNIALRGATLLHMAVEFVEIECVDLLLDRGANINAISEVIDGVGGQTPIFHAIGTMHGAGVAVLEHLARRGTHTVDLSVRGTFRLFDEPQRAITPLEYAEQMSRPDVPEFRRTTPREIELLQSLSIRP